MTALKKVVRLIPKSGPDSPPALKIMDAISPSINGAVNDRYIVINRDKIDANPYQPRKKFDTDTLKELAESMYKFGQIQAITVRPHPTRAGRYQLISGERRLRASKPNADFNGLPQLKAIVRDAKDNEMADLAFTENIQRDELTPAETVAIVRQLSKNGFSQIMIEDHFKKSRNWAYKHLKAAKAGDDVNWMLDYPSTINLVIYADKLKDTRIRYQAIQFLKSRVEQGCSVRELKEFVESKEVPKAAPRQIAANTQTPASSGWPTQTPRDEADASNVTPRPDASNNDLFDNGGVTVTRTFEQPAQPARTVQTTFEYSNGQTLIEGANLPRHFDTPTMLPETVAALPSRCIEALTAFLREYSMLQTRGDFALERRIGMRQQLDTVIANAEHARELIEI